MEVVSASPRRQRPYHRAYGKPSCCPFTIMVQAQPVALSSFSVRRISVFRTVAFPERDRRTIGRSRPLRGSWGHSGPSAASMC